MLKIYYLQGTNIAEKTYAFWQKTSCDIGPQYKGGPNVAECANIGDIGPPPVLSKKNHVCRF
jgi:hypothetical protein